MLTVDSLTQLVARYIATSRDTVPVPILEPASQGLIAACRMEDLPHDR